MEIRQNVKFKKPLIHYITNPISINDCANMILAAGAKPIMAEHPLEVSEITSASKSLGVNIGNITDNKMKSMLISGKTAYENKIPQVIDLVGVGCSKLRLDYAKKFISECHPNVIKGNMSEIKAIYGIKSSAKGIDVGACDIITEQNFDENIEMIKRLSMETGSVVAATGVVDIISNGTYTYIISNGCEMLSMITGTGCMLTGIIASYISSGNILEGTALAIVLMGICGELSQHVKGTGSFRNELIDNIFSISDDIIIKKIRINSY
ncbi:hydroxyethylthiazole kinase [Clostridium botulinum]|uniref:Hydroxyethylthiazole kinase 2 n=1 Tax=Clostridium botulinum (strain Langeland / NCTC 10281 / Type F) TaxID=441772 RepID=THIM2_CLOBL|nr:hydroxyethylthiazole kinase [Clostridium botulinum]A7GFJ3.1 RecName: Full=Hydroxyethylthiazole kinase 2; AltName: Full=4-methyl-5-beta-hydroxyethylthiazole kinase 2; Short=TH kinase 2; Short=Thz kinase 2 [Clostridium botulinum F str. Langeland]ABS39869.1 hydroxyethylthiazole kinase [Clostridium botulinum F str. Langeland]KKM43432.1 hydroxyethylthiazole kinase [Clostridium botulinum]MBY6793036.1 hydroxyethylthiazole kinase [Clostridium botulinum]MBY6937246.1 hydroxyethylthiazole kinase [Clos